MVEIMGIVSEQSGSRAVGGVLVLVTELEASWLVFGGTVGQNCLCLV